MAERARNPGAAETTPARGAERWRLACRAAELCAIDPAGLGGVHVKGRMGPALDEWLKVLRRNALTAPVIKTASGVQDDRLIGGLDLAGTLAAGRPVLEPGLMSRADGGMLVISGAERLSNGTAARIASALDDGAVSVARDGVSMVLAARFGVVLLDEGDEDDRPPPAALLDRMAFRVDLAGLSRADTSVDHARPDRIDTARAALAAVEVPDGVIMALCEAAAAFGIASPRAALLAVRAACAIAASDGKVEIDAEAAREAAVLVLGPRAATAPTPEADEDEESDSKPELDDGPQPPPEVDSENLDSTNADALTESVVEAVRAVLPADLLAGLPPATTATVAGSGRATTKAPSKHRGRQIGARPGVPRGGARLDMLATLRAAAPWQKLRKQANDEDGMAERRIAIRRDDFRIRNFEQASETLTIFLVDASGSAALHRLGEAKGAVELLLADCYVRRDSVALIAFRGTTSTLELPPTRSLTRAKRSLSGLPGGGGTPLAHALLQAGRLAGDAQRRGVSPGIVILTDCRTNVALDGEGGRARAEADAIDASNVLARAGLPVLLVDTAPRPQPFAAVLQAALRARYLALPFSDSRMVADAARALSAGPVPAARAISDRTRSPRRSTDRMKLL